MTSSFFKSVYRVVKTIPPGRVVTYGQIAAYLGEARAARTVGWALRALPEGISVPWHRVVNAQGRISLSDRGGGAQQQRIILEEEGVIFDDDGSIDLERYRWQGPA